MSCIPSPSFFTSLYNGRLVNFTPGSIVYFCPYV